MGLHAQIKSELGPAMKSRDELRLTVLRSLLTAFTNEAVAKKRKPDEEIPDDEALAVLSRAAKQRKDSIEQFEKGNRGDLAEREKKELAIVESYLPEMLGQDEIEKVVKAKKESLGIESAADKGKLIGAVMAELKGRADGGDVKAVVDKLIGA